MPLADLIPVIDDRTFDDLVAEARTRIPLYTPEWTDFNESDPGMALVELFGWMTELLIYRLGKVPQLNHLKFLELIGFELTPAAPAIAEITFPIQANYTLPTVTIPQATQVSTARPDADGPIIFETDRGLVALTAVLDAVLVFEAPSYRDQSAANQGASSGYNTFGVLGAAGSALLLGFNSTLPFPSVVVDLAFFTQSAAGSAPLACPGGVAAALTPGVIAWEYWNGKFWLPLAVVDDETDDLSQNGHLQLLAPSAGSLVLDVMGPKTDVPRYWIRGRLVQSNYQTPPRLLTVRTNTASATQAQTISYELLGGSNGNPNQTFNTSGTPILAASMLLEVDEGAGFLPWAEVPDFLGSGPNDANYILDRTAGQVRFGDGTQGRIPVANANNRTNIRATSYRVGGGTRGNMAAGQISSLMSSLPGVAADQIGNLFPSGGGADEESLQQAVLRAPGMLRTRDRAVTPEDFENLAEEAGAARAKALPLVHPSFPGVQVPGVVSVVVVPDVPGPRPTPNPLTLSAVCSYLDTRRLLTTEVYVVPPRYRTITVTAHIIVEDTSDLATVQQLAQATLTQYFDPLTGGEDSSATAPGTGWPFGGGIYFSQVMRRLLVPGVKRIASLTMQLDDTVAPPCTDLALDPDMLLSNGDHQISRAYDTESST